MNNQVLTLIGYRGSGKSCVAQALAQRLKWDWIDADEELQRREGRSISEIFETEGEPHFRELEQKLLAELLTDQNVILAAGGGAILNANTRQAMKQAGPVIWLQASATTLAARIGSDEKSAGQRPSLTGHSIETEVASVLAERTPLYAETASITIDTESNTPDEIVELILSELTNQVIREHQS